MIDEKYLELIQADVDGELPEQRRAELSQYLLAHPDARAVRDELKRVCDLLDSVPAVEPPPDLAASILGSLPLPAARARPGGLQVLWASRDVLRYAAVFAGGLLVSAIAFQLAEEERSGLDISRVAGTMASNDPVAGSAPVDTVTVAMEQVSGTVSLFRSASMRVVEFDLAARQPVEVVVTQEGREARFSSVGGPGSEAGRRYALVLDGPGKEGVPIEVRFLAAGVLIHEDRLVAKETRN